MQKHPDLDINKVDRKGQFALQIAVRNQNEDLLIYLLSKEGIKLGDALLHAVKEGNARITEILLRWKEG